MRDHIISINDLEPKVFSTMLAASTGKQLIMFTDCVTKEVWFTIMKNGNVKTVQTVDEAVTEYNNR